MKKLVLLVLILCCFLTSCTKNEIYEYNKEVLDTYSTNSNYAIVTYNYYESVDKKINLNNLINTKIMLDGKSVELIYNTRCQKTLVGDTLYFFYEYKREDDIGHHAVGYVNLKTKKVYVDYFDYERYSFDYNFSTKDFVCFTFKKDLNVIDIVFFKETNKLEFDYNLNNLQYNKEDIEEPNLKDYYIENGVKYTLSNLGHTLTNSLTGEIIELPYENNLLEIDSVIKEIYSKFQYDMSRIYATYISNGDELFLYIQDRPTNRLNAPFMIFKCNLDLSEVEYIGYTEYSINAIVNLNK